MLTFEIRQKIRKNRRMLLTPLYSMAFCEAFSLRKKKRITEDKAVLSYNSGTSLISSVTSISRNCSLTNYDT